MFNVGDTLSKAVTSGAELVPFNSSDVFYWKKIPLFPQYYTREYTFIQQTLIVPNTE